MKIAVIITHYNSSDSLLLALDSIYQQVIDVEEIIIVDDCSETEHQSVLRQLNQQKKVKVIQNEENVGYAQSLNVGISAANCEFIAIFDDDDTSHRDRLRIQVQKLNEGYDLVYTSRNTYKNNHLVNYNKTVDFNEMVPLSLSVPSYIFTGMCNGKKLYGEFGSCTLALKKSAFMVLNGFDASFRRKAEWDFVIRASIAELKLTSVDCGLVNNFKTPGIKGEKGFLLSRRMDILLLNKHKKLREKLNIYFTSKFYLAAKTHKFYKNFYKYYINLTIYRLARMLKL